MNKPKLKVAWANDPVNKVVRLVALESRQEYGVFEGDYLDLGGKVNLFDLDFTQESKKMREQTKLDKDIEIELIRAATTVVQEAVELNNETGKCIESAANFLSKKFKGDQE